jgi:hypothetical protein
MSRRMRPAMPQCERPSRCGARLLGMWTGAKVFTGLLIVVSLCFVAFMVEASVGHDGLLCELGYDKDGDGDGVTGCG